ncbi:MAG: glycosyltransferase [Actinobacteria bacterium HGW-Actinobacteria-7]|nr:MAG: glycosyltransferase [Actinobacteria bacterium HGW-Actinobacteria-7]
MTSDVTITVVMPVHDEAEQIRENVLRVGALLETAGIRHDFVLVDDGSRDETWAELQWLALDPATPVTAVRLSRNFGKEAALCAGLELATGDAVVTIDADLQHPPELIVEMVRLWREQGYEVVEGVKRDRGRQSVFQKLGAAFFYRVFSTLTGIDLNQATDFKLLDRRVVEAWRRMGESRTFFRGMTSWVGYRHIELPFDVVDRSAGRSKWSLRKLFWYAVDSTTSFTAVPLYAIAYLGLIFSLLAFALMVQTLWMKFSGSAVTGFTTVIILILVVGGAIMIDLGIIGVYLSKIYEETKARPRFVVADIVGGTADE